VCCAAWLSTLKIDMRILKLYSIPKSQLPLVAKDFSQSLRAIVPADQVLIEGEQLIGLWKEMLSVCCIPIGPINGGMLIANAPHYVFYMDDHAVARVNTVFGRSVYPSVRDEQVQIKAGGNPEIVRILEQVSVLFAKAQEANRVVMVEDLP